MRGGLALGKNKRFLHHKFDLGVQVMRDDVPKQWVPPFEGKRRPSSASAAGKPPKGKLPKEGSSSGSLQGLEAVLGSAREDRCLFCLLSLCCTSQKCRLNA